MLLLEHEETTRKIFDPGMLPLLRGLGAKLGKDLAFFDLETTTFTGLPTFGVTEAGILRIGIDGAMRMETALVDPENPIAPSASEKTGIVDSMVIGKPTFARWIPIFEELARNALVMGYNSTSFDIPGVKSQAKRYAGREIDFPDALDVRKRYVDLMRSSGNGQKGSLADAAATFGIVIDAAMHRTEADVMTTAFVAEAIIEHYGIAGLLGRVLHAMPTATENKNTVALVLDETMLRILDGVRGSGYDKMRIARSLGVSVNKVADAAWDLYNGGSLRIEEIAEADIQAWMKPRIREAVEECWDTPEDYGRLKPVRLALCAMENAPPIDYTQLKIALTMNGLR